MAIANSVVVVGTTRTTLTVPANGWLHNNGGAPVFIGASTVTADSSSTGGFVLAPGEKFGPIVTAATLYGICAAQYDETPVAEIAILSGLA